MEIPGLKLFRDGKLQGVVTSYRIASHTVHDQRDQAIGMFFWLPDESNYEFLLWSHQTESMSRWFSAHQRKLPGVPPIMTFVFDSDFGRSSIGLCHVYTLERRESEWALMLGHFGDASPTVYAIILLSEDSIRDFIHFAREAATS